MNAKLTREPEIIAFVDHPDDTHPGTRLIGVRVKEDHFTWLNDGIDWLKQKFAAADMTLGQAAGKPECPEAHLASEPDTTGELVKCDHCGAPCTMEPSGITSGVLNADGTYTDYGRRLVQAYAAPVPDRDAERMRFAGALQEILDAPISEDNMEAACMKLIVVRAFSGDSITAAQQEGKP